MLEIVRDKRSSWILTPHTVFQVLELRHGVMMVGPSGSGKTSAWRCLLSALEMLDGVKGEAHVIDPKAIGMSRVMAFWGLNLCAPGRCVLPPCAPDIAFVAAE